MYQKNVIFLISSDSSKKKKILDELKKYFDYSYLKLEALFETIIELHSGPITEIEYINFFNRFVNNLSKNNSLCILDINDCKPHNIMKLIGNNQVSLISLDSPLDIPNAIYIDISQNNITSQLEQLKKEVLV